MAAQLGFCGLDPRRLPLAGTELRGCWEPATARTVEVPAAEAAAVTSAAARRSVDPSSRLRDFVPVELRRDQRIVVVPREPVESEPASVAAPPASAVVAAAERWPAGLTLFGEREG